MPHIFENYIATYSMYYYFCVSWPLILRFRFLVHSAIAPTFAHFLISPLVDVDFDRHFKHANPLMH